MNSGSPHGNTDQNEVHLPRFLNDLPARIDPDVFRHLPKPIRQLMTEFDDAQEKEMLLFATIVLLSGILPNLWSRYDRRVVYPNLYLFIVAPAGAGKGALSWIRQIANPIHEKHLKESEKQRVAIKNGKDQNGYKVQLPPRRTLYIPANISASAFLKALHDNNGTGIFFCPEADTLSDSIAQEWGNFSTAMRLAFHHEPIEQQRRKDDEYLRIQNPKLSIILSGTPDQVHRLFKSSENGLFSRFIFYRFEPKYVFRNVFPELQTNIETAVANLSDICLKLHGELINRNKPVQFVLSEANEKRLVSEFEKLFNIATGELGSVITASVKRLGLIVLRITIVLTAIRKHSELKADDIEVVIMDDKDFEIALSILNQMLRQTVIQISHMPANNSGILNHRKHQKLLDSLPENFKRMDALEIANQISISPASLTRFLATSGYVEQIAHGIYRKTIRNDQMIK